jgi:hypothetical protein
LILLHGTLRVEIPCGFDLPRSLHYGEDRVAGLVPAVESVEHCDAVGADLLT